MNGSLVTAIVRRGLLVRGEADGNKVAAPVEIASARGWRSMAVTRCGPPAATNR
jgi:hypothetical protein